MGSMLWLCLTAPTNSLGECHLVCFSYRRDSLWSQLSGHPISTIPTFTLRGGIHGDELAELRQHLSPVTLASLDPTLETLLRLPMPWKRILQGFIRRFQGRCRQVVEAEASSPRPGPREGGRFHLLVMAADATLPLAAHLCSRERDDGSEALVAELFHCSHQVLPGLEPVPM